MLVHECGAFAASVEHVDDSGQFLEVDEHLRGDIFRGSARRRDAHRNGFAHLPHLAAREYGLFGRLETRQRRIRYDRFHVVEIGQRIDGFFQTGRLLDSNDMAMCDRTAHERDVDHSDHADIADIFAAAMQEAVIFLARQRGADALRPVRRLDCDCTFHRLPREESRVGFTPLAQAATADALAS